MPRLRDLWYVDEEHGDTVSYGGTVELDSSEGVAPKVRPLEASGLKVAAPEPPAAPATDAGVAEVNQPLGSVSVRRNPIPSWARFMVDLGADIALLSAGVPTTAVVSLPTRDFAAAFAAAAVVVTYDELDPAAPDNLTEHLEDLRVLKQRARVQYQEKTGGKVSEGFWKGFEIDGDGEEFFCFEGRVKGGKNMMRKLPVSEALRLVPSGDQRTDGRLRVRDVVTPDLLRGLRGQHAAMAVVTTERCEALLVGQASVLQDEMCAQGLFLSGDPEDLRHGYLQDLVRVLNFPGVPRFYRSQVVTTSARNNDEQKSLKPRVVIYDGGRMYLQCGHLWRDSHRIVVLDRSAANAEDAALEIGQDFAYRRGLSELGEGLTVPAGVEFIAFEHET